MVYIEKGGDDSSTRQGCHEDERYIWLDCWGQGKVEWDALETQRGVWIRRHRWRIQIHEGQVEWMSPRAH